VGETKNKVDEAEIDGSFEDQDDRGGIGMILRDSAGQVIFTSWHSLDYCTEVLEAEFLASKEGLSLRIQWMRLLIVVETDCSTVVQLLQAKTSDKSGLAYIVKEAKELMTGHREIVLNKVHRSKNNISSNRARCETLLVF
jgi:ribonuclease HI